jgi:hypothetical protein
LPPVAAAFLLGAYALYMTGGSFDPPDFFIYRLGSELALRGENPYDLEKVHGHVAQRFTDEMWREFRANNGYFLPPMAVLLFAPFALLPWAAAKIAWAVTLGISAYFVARLPTMLRGPGKPPGVLATMVAPFALVVNPVALAVAVVGQTSFLFAGGAAAGLLAFSRGRPMLGAALWVIPFVKPHVALPLIPLAWYLGGWRPAVLLVGLLAVVNAIGATIVGGSPLFLTDYLAYLHETRGAVQFNRAEMNPAILSWNRLVIAVGGPVIELGLLGMVAGYCVWFGLAVGRVALAGRGPSVAWVVATVVVGAMLCSQVIVYEAIVLVLAAPWVRELFATGYRLRGSLAIALMAAHLFPQAKVAELGLGSHHSLAVLLLAVLVLVGPTGAESRAGAVTSSDSSR